MKNEIVLLHLSDMHMSADEEPEIKLRIDALFNDISDLGLSPDLIVFSGDVTNAGSVSEFREALKLLFEPLKSRCHCSFKRMILVPGNHDIDRSKIDAAKDKLLRETLTDTVIAQAQIDSSKTYDDRLGNYYDFASNFSKSEQIYITRKEELAGVDLGIAGLNSAWRCSPEEDFKHLFLTSKQINMAADELAKCDLTIAVFHHPCDWLHPSEDSVPVSDLQKRFNILLSGHLHDNQSLYSVSPSSKTIQITAPAFFSKRKRPEGYNIYRISPTEKTLTAFFRKFIRTRRVFDKNVDHAPDGMFTIDLPIATLARKAVLVQRVSGAISAVQERLKKQLLIFQPRKTPILVTPKLQKFTWKDNSRSNVPYVLEFRDICERSTFLFGERESGKTVFLENLVEQLASGSNKGGLKIAAYYLDFREHFPKTPEPEQWRKFLEEWKKEYASAGDHQVILAIDNLPEEPVELIDITIATLQEAKVKFVVSLSNPFLVDALHASGPAKDFNFLNMGQWGPSRIREFTKKFFVGTPIDPEAAYLFVRRSLEETDLPASPVIVTLYLAVFEKLGSRITSLSFLNLLEQLENVRLESADAHTYSFYNKREILMRIAVLCFKQGELSISLTQVRTLIRDFFEEKLLEVDVDKFIEILVASRIVTRGADELGFAYYVFFDYYFAQALFKGVINVEAAIASTNDFLQYGTSLAFLGGFSREDTRTLSRLLDTLISTFPTTTRFTLKELDTILDQICDVEDIADTADEAASKHIGKEGSAEADDPEFETKRSLYGSRRRSLKELVRADGETAILQKKIRLLQVFYNLFRNLENIKGSEKIKYLDTVLDYHIQTNLDLIRFFEKLNKQKDFGAFSAYVVTLGSQMFLASHMGNQALKITIERCESGTDNDFKRLLLVMLYCDLRLPEYINKIEVLLNGTESCAAIELIFAKAKYLLLTYDGGDKIPAALVSLFRAAFVKRQLYYKKPNWKAAYQKEYKEILRWRNQIAWQADALKGDVETTGTS